jgi:NADPH:quinone reductase-like Zn-dependent oxidoreductase
VKAIRYVRYGGPEVLELSDVDTPVPGVGELLVRVRAAAVNPLDFHFLRGTPYLVRLQAGLTRPKAHGLGVDMAGTVEALGPEVTRFRPGDEVFGSCTGAFAGYVTVHQDKAIAAKPANLTFEQAASVPVAGYTALQALRDKAGVRAGQSVLVNGAAGGVGTFAVQLAKALGAEVTGVCRTANVELVSSIGADHVVDYTREDYTATGRRYDVIVDIAGSRSLADNRRALAPAGVLVGVGGPDRGKWLGPLAGLGAMVLGSLGRSQKMRPMLAQARRDDLVALAGLLESGKVTPVIDRTYPLAEVPDAIAYLERGHARGKVVVDLSGAQV